MTEQQLPWVAAAIRATYPRIGQADAIAYAKTVHPAWRSPMLAIGMADTVDGWRDYYGAMFTLPHITGRHRELARDYAPCNDPCHAAKAIADLGGDDAYAVLVCLYHSHADRVKWIHRELRELGH